MFTVQSQITSVQVPLFVHSLHCIFLYSTSLLELKVKSVPTLHSRQSVYFDRSSFLLMKTLVFYGVITESATPLSLLNLSMYSLPFTNSEVGDSVKLLEEEMEI